MEYKEILDSARTCIGPYCKACPVCNGKACGNQVPGPGAKAPGSGFIRNFDAWQKICVNMDTICPNEPVDTAVELFGTMYRYPFFAAPLGAMKLHYGEKYTDREYNSILVNACADSGIAAFTGDGVDAAVFQGAMEAIRTGTDVFKALALGADAVLIGRPFVPMVYGDGAQGVATYIEKIGSELRDTMAMCGVHTLDEITRDCVRVM